MNPYLLLGGLGILTASVVVLSLKFRVSVKSGPKTLPKITEEEVEKDDIPKKEKVFFEIRRSKGDVPIVIKTGQLSKRKEWVRFKLEGVWRSYFPNHFIKRTVKGKVSYLVRFNVYYSEALKVNADEPDYDQALENHLLYDWASQYKKAVGAVAGLLAVLAKDRSIQTLLALAAVFGIPIGMALWPQFFPIPNTVVHWVP